MKDNWKIVKLGEVAETGAGGTPLKSHNEYYENGNIPWLRSGEVDKKDIIKSELCITELGLKNSSARLFPINTVLVAMYGATAGQVGILRFEASTNQAICGIFPNERFIPEYLYYYFVYSKKELVSQAVGGAQPNISQIKICNTLIPLPPLDEQKSIVKRLDEAFEKIARARESAEKSLADAKELFQSELSKLIGGNGKLSKLKIDNGEWKIVKLGDVAEYHKEQGVFSDLQYIGMENMESGTGRILQTVDSSTMKSTSFKFQEGEVLYGRLRPYLKKVYVAEFDGCCSTEVFPIKTKGVLPHFLKYWFLTDEVTNALVKTSAGCRMPRANMNEALDFEFPLPPLETQKSIVAQLDSLAEQIRKLEQNYTRILADCDELKQSILAKTFDN